jgi:hypothetical protein
MQHLPCLLVVYWTSPREPGLTTYLPGIGLNPLLKITVVWLQADLFQSSGHLRKRNSIPIWCEMKQPLLNRKLQIAFCASFAIFLVVGCVLCLNIGIQTGAEIRIEHRLPIPRIYQSQANCHITKPVDLEGFLKVVKSIDTFWLSVVKRPHEVVS